MKATDLMVGDWVNIKGKSVKVTLDDLRTMLILFEDVDFHIDPIPLTEDILVKNGWFALDEYRYEGDVALAKESSGFRLKNTNICVNSVHQLQHLLRLAGVQKGIEL